MIRLNRYIASCGICSRRNADKLIQEGRISVNGEKILEPGFQIDLLKDRVFYRSGLLKPQEKEYYLFYKPEKVLTSCKRDPLYPDRKIVTDYILQDKRLFYVGRLDYDAEGLILLTNDGMLAQKIAHPSYEIEKQYRVMVDKEISPEESEKLKQGFHYLDKCLFMKKIGALGKKNRCYEYQVVLVQGIKRQIKVMFQELGVKTLSIKRVAFGPLNLGKLKPGQYRPLTEKERRSLIQLME